MLSFFGYGSNSGANGTKGRLSASELEAVTSEVYTVLQLPLHVRSDEKTMEDDPVEKVGKILQNLHSKDRIRVIHYYFDSCIPDQSRSLLSTAIIDNHPKALQLFLSVAGVSIDETQLSQMNHLHRSPLFWGVNEINDQCCKILLSFGANPNQLTKCVTDQRFALSSLHTDKTMAAEEANRVKDDSNNDWSVSMDTYYAFYSPLMAAINPFPMMQQQLSMPDHGYFRQLNIASYLLSYGANVNLPMPYAFSDVSYRNLIGFATNELPQLHLKHIFFVTLYCYERFELAEVMLPYIDIPQYYQTYISKLQHFYTAGINDINYEIRRDLLNTLYNTLSLNVSRTAENSVPKTQKSNEATINDYIEWGYKLINAAIDKLLHAWVYEFEFETVLTKADQFGTLVISHGNARFDQWSLLRFVLFRWGFIIRGNDNKCRSLSKATDKYRRVRTNSIKAIIKSRQPCRRSTAKVISEYLFGVDRFY